MLRYVFMFTAVLSLAASAGRADVMSLPEKVEFNRDIRPILSDTCFKCHGFDPATRKAKLRLDTPEGATAPRKGLPAITPGDPAKSDAWLRVATDDHDELMPPADSGLKLTGRQKALFKRWIEQGAKYEGHWAYLPPKPPALPAVGDGSWAINDLDRFILARLEREGLKPSSPAPKETLIRRLSLDLTGLPPTPKEVEAFLADASPDAHEKLVDRLLASPHYGERMASSWLDAARYADTSGYQADWERLMWPWRDWVVKAFNENKPFDQFAIEQLAGDMLPGATLEQKLATGFNRNHRINDEGGIIPEEYAVEYVVDRVETTTAVFLGLTAGCARCHDHKYDPVTQKEFFQLYAYFNNVPEKGKDGRQGYATPFIRVPDPEAEAQIEAASREVAELRKAFQTDDAAAIERRRAWEKNPGGDAWAAADVTKATATAGVVLKKLGDESFLATGNLADNSVYEFILAAPAGKVSAIRFDALTHESLPRKSVGREDGVFVLSEFEVELTPKGGKPQKLPIASAFTDRSDPSGPLNQAIDGKVDTGWYVDGANEVEPRSAVFVLAKALDVPAEATLKVRLRQQSTHYQATIGRARLSLTTSPNPPLFSLTPELLAALKVDPEMRPAEQERQLADHFRWVDPSRKELRERIATTQRKLESLHAKSVPVMVMDELPKRRPTYLLKRGQYDQPDTSVQLTPALPASLFSGPSQPKDRLELAKWIASPQNPLTARVTVNRIWQMYFGTGLVKTAEDFGAQGEWPSHPELLDHLATGFAKDWDLKRLHKLIVTSATYRQSSRATKQLLEKDPENRLLARGPRHRLDAFSIRDNALAISGLLVPRLGGAPVKPYQPAGLWEELAFTDKTTVDKYVQDHGEKLYRRGLYVFWKRSVPPPGLMTFDASGREACSVRTGRTNTPLQALTLLNDVTYVEAARALAQRMLAGAASTPHDRITHGFRLATARKPSERELAILTASLAKHLEKYAKDPAAARALVTVGESKRDESLDPVQHAAYTALANTLLNLDETITKE